MNTNRALQSFIVAASSDKIASQTASQAVVTTMLFGIIIGNMQLGTILSVIGMLPSIVFAFIGAKYAGKHGNKRINGDMDLCMHDSDSYTCRIIYTDRSDADRDSSADDDRVCRTYFNLKWS